MPIPDVSSETVRLATTGNINLNEPPRVIDGVRWIHNDKILVKDQLDPTENGVYFVRRYRFSRPTVNELVSGSTIMVQEGHLNADKLWVLTTDNPITLRDTPLTFEQIAFGGRYVSLDEPNDWTSAQNFTAGITVNNITGPTDVAGGLRVDGSSVATVSYVDNATDLIAPITDELYQQSPGVLKTDGVIRSASSPTDPQDLTTKKYVDFGPIVLSYGVKTVSYFLNVDVDGMVAFDSSLGILTAVLPEAPPHGTRFEIKDAAGMAGTNNIRVSAQGSDTVDGLPTRNITTGWESMTVVYDATNQTWYRC